MKKQFGLNSRFLAKVISFISNPFLVIFLAIVIGNYDEIASSPGAMLMFLIVSAIVPLLVYTYQLSGHKDHFWHFVSLDRITRNPVYLISIYCQFFNILIFAYLGNPFWLFQSILMFSFFVIMFLINRYIDKVSMHAAAFAFATFYLVNTTSIYCAFLLIFLPLIFWSRIKLHRHTPFQLFLGTMIGLLIGLLSWLR